MDQFKKFKNESYKKINSKSYSKKKEKKIPSREKVAMRSLLRALPTEEGRGGLDRAPRIKINREYQITSGLWCTGDERPGRM